MHVTCGAALTFFCSSSTLCSPLAGTSSDCTLHRDQQVACHTPRRTQEWTHVCRSPTTLLYTYVRTYVHWTVSHNLISNNQCNKREGGASLWQHQSPDSDQKHSVITESFIHTFPSRPSISSLPPLSPVPVPPLTLSSASLLTQVR